MGASQHAPERAAVSHETALLVLGLSDINPVEVHLTAPNGARFRREYARV